MAASAIRIIPKMTPASVSGPTATQAAAMVEYWHRFYLQALKALQNQRRSAPRVVISRAGQVNVAQHQINVGSHG